VVDFEKRSMIKSQILANFVAEWAEPGSIAEGVVFEASWLIYCDGAWGQRRNQSGYNISVTIRNQAPLCREVAFS
jgi:2-polyprenyl-6-methoxyphenol hydroxylase-like FAD-dependent oxidoreductase